MEAYFLLLETDISTYFPQSFLEVAFAKLYAHRKANTKFYIDRGGGNSIQIMQPPPPHRSDSLHAYYVSSTLSPPLCPDFANYVVSRCFVRPVEEGLAVVQIRRLSFHDVMISAKNTAIYPFQFLFSTFSTTFYIFFSQF